MSVGMQTWRLSEFVDENSSRPLGQIDRVGQPEVGLFLVFDNDDNLETYRVDEVGVVVGRTEEDNRCWYVRLRPVRDTHDLQEEEEILVNHVARATADMIARLAGRIRGQQPNLDAVRREVAKLIASNYWLGEAEEKGA